MMLAVAYLLMVFLGFFLRDSRLYNITGVILFGILAWLNTDSADYANIYLKMYANPDTFYDIDPGWGLLCKLFSMLGFSYNGFACIIAMCSVSLLLFYAKKITANTSFFLALFLIYPGLMSLVQFRQFFASALIALAIAVFEGKGFRKYILFIVLVFLAFTMHRSALIMLPLLLLFAYQHFSLKERQILVIIAVVVIVLLVTNIQMISYEIFGEAKTNSYLHPETNSAIQSTTILGGLKNTAFLILMYVISNLQWHHYFSKIQRKEGEMGWLRKLDLARFSNTVVLLLIPFMFITTDFMRMERYAFTLTLGLFAIMPSMVKREQSLIVKAMLACVCILFCYAFVVRGSFDVVIGALLSFEYVPSFFA